MDVSGIAGEILKRKSEVAKREELYENIALQTDIYHRCLNHYGRTLELGLSVYKVEGMPAEKAIYLAYI